jgi:hypothetical protein
MSAPQPAEADGPETKGFSKLNSMHFGKRSRSNPTFSEDAHLLLLTSSVLHAHDVFADTAS